MLRIWASRQVRRGIAGAFAFSCLCVRRLGEPLDRGEPPVPLRGEVSHGPGGLVETAGFYLVEALPALRGPRLPRRACLPGRRGHALRRAGRSCGSLRRPLAL